MRTPKVTGRIIAYARVSQADQHLDLQLNALRAAGAEDANIYTDKLSGKNTARPGLQAAMAACQPGDVFTFWKVDRVGRSLHDLVNILDTLGKRGVFLKCLTQPIDTTTAHGRAFLGMLAVFAEFEREMILERTRSGLEAARAKGIVGGKYERFKDGRQRIVLDDARKAQVLAMTEAGQSSREIAAALGIQDGAIRMFLSRHRAALRAQT